MINRALVLASASPRRRELLTLAGYTFDTQRSHYDEDALPVCEPREYARKLAVEKAKVVAEKRPDDIVLGADTIVAKNSDEVSETNIFGKPKSNEHAREILTALSGSEHSVVTGYSIICRSRNIEISKSVETIVWFRDISSTELEHYIVTREPFDKAGAYGIQGFASCFVEKIHGSYSNVVGLPVAAVVLDLESLGVTRF